MILLDTNVISELLKPGPDPRVVAWLDRQPPPTLHLSAVTVAELYYGLGALDPGQRRDRLRQRLETELLPALATLAVDHTVGAECGRLRAEARTRGRAIAIADGLIAATAAVHGLIVATRDTAPFAAAGVDVIDPWTEQ